MTKAFFYLVTVPSVSRVFVIRILLFISVLLLVIQELKDLQLNYLIISLFKLIRFNSTVFQYIFLWDYFGFSFQKYLFHSIALAIHQVLNVFELFIFRLFVLWLILFELCACSGTYLVQKKMHCSA